MTRRILLLALATCAFAPTAAASAAPAVSIDDVSHLEGNSASSKATFTVRLTAPAPAGGVSVSYATADGSARAPGDYTAASGVATVPSGATSVPIDVSVVGDALSEGNETFSVNLSSPTNGATLADAQGVGTIVNDDSLPSLRVNDVSVLEGTGGSRAATFTLSLSRPSGQDVSVAYATSNGSARAPGDYTPAAGTAVIPAGARQTTVNVGVIGDTRHEPDETFALRLSRARNASIRDGTGIARIRDDDAANRPPRVTHYGVAPKVFRAGRRAASLAARPVGTKVSYRLSERARVVFRVQRLRRVRGHRRYVTLSGNFSRASAGGRNVLRFTGRLRHRRLAAGRYRLVVVAVDPQGLRSPARAVAFRISG